MSASSGNDFTVEQTAILEDISVTLSVFSFIGCLFIIFFYWKLREVRSFVFELVFWVAVSDAGFSIGKFLGDAGGNENTHLGASNALCVAQAFIISYFGLASMLWSAAIAFTLHMAFLNGDARFRTPQVEQRWKWYHSICFGYPLLMACLPFSTDAYGDTGGWCWIMNDTKDDKVWRYIQFYIILWIVIIYVLYVYVRVYNKMQAITSSGGQDMREQAKRVRLYPLVLFICYFWSTVNTIYQTIIPGDGLLWLNAVALFFAAALPLANAFVYGFTPIIRRELKVYLGLVKNDEQDPDTVDASVKHVRVGSHGEADENGYTEGAEPLGAEQMGMENEESEVKETAVEREREVGMDDDNVVGIDVTGRPPEGTSFDRPGSTVFHQSPSHPNPNIAESL